MTSLRVARSTLRFGAAAIVLFSALALLPAAALAQYVQQGAKLVGTGAVGGAEQGFAVAISSDGNTAAVGGPADNANKGAVWIFTRSNGLWTQQGNKLVGTGGVGNSSLGSSIAISGDGNTVVTGGHFDNSSLGAAWVFTRSNGVWTQQGNKLVGTNSESDAEQGTSVAVSADGDTLVVGGPQDDVGVGAAWVYTRTNGVWTQLGSKLVGTGVDGTISGQGTAVALSGDATTAVLGGPQDGGGQLGATWAFIRHNGAWSQQQKMVWGNTLSISGQPFEGSSTALSLDGNTAVVGGPGTNSGAGEMFVFQRLCCTSWLATVAAAPGDAVGAAKMGTSIAISLDGQIAIAGGPGDNANTGAAWIFTKNSAGGWTQLGNKLVGSGADVASQQGTAVALSGNGSTAIVGDDDTGGAGGAWIFARAFTPLADSHDLNGDGYSDILWRDTSGNVAAWLMTGALVAQSAGVGNAPTTWAIAGQRDFNGDGTADILWHDTSGNVAIWFMSGAHVIQSAGVGNAPTTWSIAGTGDFNGDGYGDILWHDTSGDVAIWFMKGSQVVQSLPVGNVPTNWSIAGVGDFNGDGYSDILWRDTSGKVAIWEMNGAQVINSFGMGNANPAVWSIAGTIDFNAARTSAILWHDTSGDVALWGINNSSNQIYGEGIGSAPATWSIVATGDYNGDGAGDILWHDTSGNVAIWFLGNPAGCCVLASTGVGAAPTTWSVQGLNGD